MKKTQKVEMPKEFTKLLLRDVKVIFANLVDEGFGTSITIDVTDEKVKQQVIDWVAENKIGKDNPGVANIKEYTPEEGNETTYQFSFKINDHTKYRGLDTLTKENLGFGAVVDLVANAFAFDNKFGKGVSQSLSAVLIKKGTESSADADMGELMEGVEEF